MYSNGYSDTNLYYIYYSFQQDIMAIHATLRVYSLSSSQSVSLHSSCCTQLPQHAVRGYDTTITTCKIAATTQRVTAY